MKSPARQPAKSPAPPAASRPRHLLAFLGLAVITTLAYANSFSAGFPLDNNGLILQDTRVHAVNAVNVDRILNHSYWWPIGESGLYRPVTTLSYLFNYAILGNADRPFGYHVVNLLLHIANVLLVYALILRVIVRVNGSSPGGSSRRHDGHEMHVRTRGAIPFAIASLWAVHPLSTEAVTNIVGRADLLAGSAVLGGLLLWIKSTETSGARRVWLFVALGVVTGIGVFAKESAVVVAPLIVVYGLCFHKSGRPIVPALLAMVPALLLLWIQRAAVLGAAPAAEFPFVDNPIVGAGFWTGRWTAVVVMARYLWLAVWPLRLSADYSYAQIPLATGHVWDWLATGTVVASVLGGLLLWRRARTAFFFATFALLTFLPASNLLFPSGTIMAERVMYLPLVGIVGLVVMGVLWLADRTATPTFAVAIGVMMALCIARTWIRNADWQSDLSLWSSTVQSAPRSFKAHRGFAEALYESDPAHANINQVIAEHERSVSVLEPLPDAVNDAHSYRQAGADYMELGDSLRGHGGGDGTPAAPPALRAYERSAVLLRRCLAIIDAAPGPLKSTPAADANRLLSAVLVRLRQADQAIAAATRARALEPDNVVGYRQAAAAFLAGSRNDDAAVSLMTGSMVTGDQSLRDELVDLYRRGLDPLRCAIVSTPAGLAIDPTCDTVRRHACAATAEAVQIHIRAGRRSEAERLNDGAVRQFQCRPVLSSTP